MADAVDYQGDQETNDGVVVPHSKHVIDLSRTDNWEEDHGFPHQSRRYSESTAGQLISETSPTIQDQSNSNSPVVDADTSIVSPSGISIDSTTSSVNESSAASIPLYRSKPSSLFLDFRPSVEQPLTDQSGDNSIELSISPTTQSGAQSSDSPIRQSSPSTPSHLPDMTCLGNLTLHSPSSHIVGTPFATNSIRFEYPFPATPSPPTASGSPSTSTVSTASLFPSLLSSATTSEPAPSLSPIPPPSPSPPPIFPAIANAQHTLALSMMMFPIEYSSASSTAMAHPKMRVSPPPVPPGLMKKRERWAYESRRGTQHSFTGVPSPDILQHPLMGESTYGDLRSAIPSMGEQGGEVETRS